MVRPMDTYMPTKIEWTKSRSQFIFIFVAVAVAVVSSIFGHIVYIYSTHIIFATSHIIHDPCFMYCLQLYNVHHTVSVIDFFFCFPFVPLFFFSLSSNDRLLSVLVILHSSHKWIGWDMVHCTHCMHRHKPSIQTH